jgi:uncharacterized protein YqhQ
LAGFPVRGIFAGDYFSVDYQNFSKDKRQKTKDKRQKTKDKRDKGIVSMNLGLLAIIGIVILTAAVLLFAVYKLSEE